MSGFVVDASIAVKWFVEEENADKAVLLRHDLAAPDLIRPECANILWKKVRGGDLTPEQARSAAMFLRTVPVKLHLMAEAIEEVVDAALTFDHPAHDCVYLVLARRLGLPLITDDRRLARKASALPDGSGITVVSLDLWTP